MAGNSLIDKAVEVCGTRYRLAKQLGVSDSTINHVYQGRQGMPAVLAARIAGVAGLDPVEAALIALIEGQRDANIRAELRSLFGIAAAAVVLSLSATEAFAPVSLDDPERITQAQPSTRG